MISEEELSFLLLRRGYNMMAVCRACLCETPNEASAIFPLDKDKGFTTLGEKLAECGKINVHRDDALPKVICLTCLQLLEEAHVFMTKCQKADALLRKVLGSLEQIKKEEIDSDDEPIVNMKTKLKNEQLNGIKSESDFDDNYDIIETEECSKYLETNDTAEAVLHTKILEEKQEENSQLFKITLNEVEKENKSENKEEESIYVCKVCNKKLSTKYVYTKHLKKCLPKKKDSFLVTGKGEDRRFHCSDCDYKCHRRQAIQYHMSTHTGARPFKCDQCPRSFTQHGRLYAHKKTHSDKMYFTCAECGKQFKHKDSFNKHKNVHNTDYNFVCHICNKALKSKRTLNDHMNRHLQIKKFSCEICGLAFVTKVDFLQHSRVHSNERKYKCTFCSYHSYSKATLNVHIKRHTGERNFQCDFCNYTCFTRGTLKTHIRKHTKEQQYACPICDMKYRQSTSVNSHMLKKHGEEFKWSNTVDRRIVK